MKKVLSGAAMLVAVVLVGLAAFWLPHQVRLALWPRTELQKAANIIPSSEPVWGPWLVVFVPVLIGFLLFMYREQLGQWLNRLRS